MLKGIVSRVEYFVKIVIIKPVERRWVFNFVTFKEKVLVPRQQFNLSYFSLVHNSHTRNPFHVRFCAKFGTCTVVGVNGTLVLTIYAPMIYTAPCIMFWMRV
jgi:hypothetical protein